MKLKESDQNCLCIARIGEVLCNYRGYMQIGCGTLGLSRAQFAKNHHGCLLGK